MEKLIRHHKPQNLSDHIALAFTKFLRFLADTFFKKKYGHRAVVLETVAAVPGMVGGMWIHLTCLRKMQSDRGWIKILLDEAENERMHLMTFIEIAQPKWYERWIILAAQAIFWNFYFLLYVFFLSKKHIVLLPVGLAPPNCFSYLAFCFSLTCLNCSGVLSYGFLSVGPVLPASP